MVSLRAMSQPFPPRTLLEKMFEDKPTCLILDEFQTWYTGLPKKTQRRGCSSGNMPSILCRFSQK